MARPKRPIGALTIYAEKVPASLGTTVHRFAETDLSDPAAVNGGFKEGRLRGFGAIEQGVSNADGDHFIAQAEIEWDDTDHFTRALLDEDSTRYIGSGRDAVVTAVSDVERRAGTAASVLLRGKTVALDPTDGLGATLLVQEFLASEFGPSHPEKTIPQRRFRRPIFPDLHRDLEEQVVPIVIGAALCPGYYVGDRVEDATLLPPPPAPTYERIGSGGSTTWSYACVVRLTNGGRTTLGDPVAIDNLPANGQFTPTNGVRLFLAQYSASLQAQVEGIDLYTKQGDATDPANINPWRFMDQAGQMFDAGYQDDGDDSHEKPWNPPPTTNTAHVGRVLGRIVFAGHACSIGELWGSNGGADGEAVREPWSLGTMADVIDPSHPDWPDPEPYWDLTGTDGVTERFFGIYIDKASPRLQHHIDGRVTVVAKLCGCKQDANDPDSPTVDQSFPAWQLITQEWVVANEGKGYYTGAWAGLPTFADGVAMIDTTAVATAQATSAGLMGTAKGFISGFCLNEPIALREFYRLFNRQYCAFDFQNAHGQLAIGLINPYADPATGTRLRERVDDVQAIGAFRELRDLLENQVQGRYDWDADQRTYRSDVEAFNDTASQRAYKRTRARGEVEARFTNDPATFRTAMQLRLLIFGRPPYEGPMTLGAQCGIPLGCFQRVRLTALEGLGADGYQDRPAITMFRAIRLSEGVAEYRCWDLGRLLGTFFLQSGATREWGTVARVDGQTWGSVDDSSGKRWGSIYAG